MKGRIDNPFATPLKISSIPLRCHHSPSLPQDPEKYIEFFLEFGSYLKEGACTDATHKVCLHFWALT